MSNQTPPTQATHDDQWATVERMKAATAKRRASRTSWRDTVHTTVGTRATAIDIAPVADSVGAHA